MKKLYLQAQQYLEFACFVCLIAQVLNIFKSLTYWMKYLLYFYYSCLSQSPIISSFLFKNLAHVFIGNEAAATTAGTNEIHPSQVSSRPKRKKKTNPASASSSVEDEDKEEPEREGREVKRARKAAASLPSKGIYIKFIYIFRIICIYRFIRTFQSEEAVQNTKYNNQGNSKHL